MYPQKPVNVRIVKANGETIPVELAYNGVDEDGCHEWRCITPISPGDRMKADTLPPRTAIMLPYEGGQ